MTPTDTTAQRFLDRNYTSCVRGLCMILIVWGHTANEFVPLLERFHLGSLLLGARFATGLFLFLSGYGLTLSMKRNAVDGRYVGRHVLNLLLPYLIFWAFYLLTDLACGHVPAMGHVWTAFLTLGMPNADAWFFRTIFAFYLLYFALARIAKSGAGVWMSLIVAVYVAALAGGGVASWWWDTALCFPLGILFARRPGLRRKIHWTGLLALGVLFVVCYKSPAAWVVGTLCAPLAVCLLCAYLSPCVAVPARVPLLSYLGTNSLYVYFMEEIPIGYMSSSAVGFAVFVGGGLVLTIVLAWLGRTVETCVRRGRWQR